MHFKFADRQYAVPHLLPRPGEMVLTVKSFAPMPLPKRAEDTQFTYRNPVKKLLFFLLREGVVTTLRKAFYGCLLYNRILRARKIYGIYGTDRETGRDCLALAATSAAGFDEMTVAAAWTVELPAGADCNRIFRQLATFLSGRNDWLEEIFRYSPFAEKSPSFRLAEIMTDLREPAPESGALPIFSAAAATAEPKPRPRRAPKSSQPDLFLVGAGVYGCGFILQFLRGTHHRMLIDADPVIAARVGELFHFEEVDTDVPRGLQALAGNDNAVLCIATYHSTHLAIVEEALRINSNVRIFLEKPPVTTFDQLNRLLELRANGADIEIGYNRRSLAMVKRSRRFFGDTGQPFLVVALVKELNLPDFHWYYWPNQKTRVTGNLCHWIDLGCVFITSRPVEIFVIPHPQKRAGDEIDVVIIFADGSKISLHSTDYGDPLRGVQEYLDIRSGAKTVVIDDFLRLTMSGDGCRRVRNFWFRNKGHADMYKQYAKAIRGPRCPSCYSNEDLRRVTVAYLAVSEMCQNRLTHARIDWQGDHYDLIMDHHGEAVKN